MSGYKRQAEILAGVVIVAFFLWAVGRAVDQQIARAQGEPPIALEQPGMRYQGLTARAWAKRAVENRKSLNKRGRTIKRLRAELASREIGPTLAIRIVFGAHADAALRVAWCESRWWTGASNGQYLGLFQMGSWERDTYGHSSTALGQAQAAYRYFVASGKDWSPWDCQP